MRVAFAGTPEFAATALAAIVEAGFTVPLVLTQPDRPAGRGMKLTPSAVKQLALAHDIAVIQPVSLRLDGKVPDQAAQAREQLEAAACDVMVVAAYGLLLPPHILSLPRFGCLNIHGSLLPRWRGAAPIHRAIEAGDTQTGITIMQMDAGLDTGDMIAAESLPIETTDTTATLHDKLAELGAAMVVAALHRLEAEGVLAATPQPAAGVTYAEKIAKHEAHLDWTLDAQTLDRRIRAFDPFPGASTQIDGVTLKVWEAEPMSNGKPAQAGEILAADGNGIVVACGAGALRLTRLQKPGGRRMSVAEFMGGFPLASGQRFVMDTKQA